MQRRGWSAYPHVNVRRQVAQLDGARRRALRVLCEAAPAGTRIPMAGLPAEVTPDQARSLGFLGLVLATNDWVLVPAATAAAEAA